MSDGSGSQSFFEIIREFDISVNKLKRKYNSLLEENVDLHAKLQKANKELLERSKYYFLLSENEKMENELSCIKQELFEARRDYLVDTADISDKPYLDERIEDLKREIFG